MTNSSGKSPSPVTVSDVYQTLTSLVMHSEQVRWGRVNTFLVIGSFLIAAWAAVLVGTTPFPDKKLLLFVLCLPGFLLGVLWARLGWRSSEYMDDFHQKAFEIESHFPDEFPKPFHLSEKRRKGVRQGLDKFTSSKWLVTAIPALFSVFFLLLAWFSCRIPS